MLSNIGKRTKTICEFFMSYQMCICYHLWNLNTTWNLSVLLNYYIKDLFLDLSYSLVIHFIYFCSFNLWRNVFPHSAIRGGIQTFTLCAKNAKSCRLYNTPEYERDETKFQPKSSITKWGFRKGNDLWSTRSGVKQLLSTAWKRRPRTTNIIVLIKLSSRV